MKALSRPASFVTSTDWVAYFHVLFVLFVSFVVNLSGLPRRDRARQIR